MKTNPVYRREIMVSTRSFRLALILMVFNGILALVALLNMYSALVQVRLTAEVQYASFLDLYLFVAGLEFVMLIGIMPAITAGSISGERERQTLELLMATRMTPAQIVFGKLTAALSTMSLLIVSSFPILAMVFVYGGVTVRDIGLLLLCYLAAAWLAGSLGIFCSSICRRTTTSTVAAYAVMGVMVLGTYGINQFAYYMSGMQTVSFLAAAPQSSGSFLYLMLLNPASTFLLMISELTGRQQVSANVAVWFGDHGDGMIFSHWIGFSILLQVILAVVLVAAAVRVLDRKK